MIGNRDIVVQLYSYSGEPQDLRLFHASPNGLGKASPLMPRALRDPIVFKFLENNCGGNVFNNKVSFRECCGGRDLKVVVGGYGLCKGSPGTWFEWGGYDLTAEEMLRCPLTGKKNCHLWLEDDEGKVYDYLPPYIQNMVAKMFRKTIDTSNFFCGTLILGMTKDELKNAGIEYVPARPDEQKKVVRHTLQRMTLKQL